MDAIWKQPDGNGGYYTVYHETKAELVKYSDTTVANVLNNLPLNNVSADMQNLWSASDAAAARRILGVNRATIYDECPVNWFISGTPVVSNGKIIFDGASYVRRSLNITLGGTNPFTIETFATVNEDTTSVGKPCVFLYADANNNIRLNVRDNVPRLAFMQAGTDNLWDGSANIYGDERHLALTYDGATVRAFVDGELVGSLSQVLTEKTYVINLSFVYDTSSPIYLKSTLDEFRISDICRYTADFTPVTRHELDEHTLTLLHFDD